MKIFNRYNPKPPALGLDFTGHDEVANQQLAEECEISKILNKYADGVIDQVPVVRDVHYNDKFITPESFSEAKAMIDKVKTDFYSLPVETQRKFGDINTYVSDLYQMAQGNSNIIAKYNNINVPVVSSDLKSDTDLTGASEYPSSSLSGGDTKTDTSAVK